MIKNKKISFVTDYNVGAIPEIMESLENTNLDRTVGYGEDDYCKRARTLIKKSIKAPDADVYFLVGGTQTNTVMISHALKPFEGVICATTGHINVHETGAIEATGHKVISIPEENGKITVEEIDKAVKNVLPPHMVAPKMVYISNPTELGTLYTKKELVTLYKYCKKNNLYLYLDGARLAMALGSPANDILLEDYPKYTDAFYIGGTKCGALFGEALVIINNELKDNIGYIIKQKGGLFAKGRLLGIQFETLFKNNLYEKYGKHAVDMAMKLKEVFAKGAKEYVKSYTNQQFIVLPKKILKELSTKYDFELWCDFDKSNSVIRFVTSWASDISEINNLKKDFPKIMKSASNSKIKK